MILLLCCEMPYPIENTLKSVLSAGKPESFLKPIGWAEKYKFVDKARNIIINGRLFFSCSDPGVG